MTKVLVRLVPEFAVLEDASDVLPPALEWKTMGVAPAHVTFSISDGDLRAMAIEAHYGFVELLRWMGGRGRIVAGDEVLDDGSESKDWRTGMERAIAEILDGAR